MPVQSRDAANIKTLQEHLDVAAAMPRNDVTAIRSLADQLDSRPVMPVIGAGGSVDCGMRLARDLAADLHDEYTSAPAMFAPYPEGVESFRTDLGAVADAIGLTQTQRQLVETLGLDQEALWPSRGGLTGHFCAYRPLSRLAREGIFTEAITFNYDCGFEAGLDDEGFLFGPSTMRGRRWHDHATTIADAGTNAELQPRGAFVLYKVHGCTARYREVRGLGSPPFPEDAIILRWTQLLDWRRDYWARDVLSERARRHVLLLLGFSGQDPVIHIGLTRVLEEIYASGAPGAPRVIVVGWEPDTLSLRLLRRAGRGGRALSATDVDFISTQGHTTTAFAMVLLTEMLAIRLRHLLTRSGVVLGRGVDTRIASLALAAPAMLRWSFLLRRPLPWQDYAQRINLVQAAGRGYVPLTADPYATVAALAARQTIRSQIGLTIPESTREALANNGFVVQRGGGEAFMPTGLSFAELRNAARHGGELENARRTLAYPSALECVLVGHDGGRRRGISLHTGAEVRVP